MSGPTGPEIAAAARARLTAELEALTPEQRRERFQTWSRRFDEEEEMLEEECRKKPRSRKAVLALLVRRIEQCEELQVFEEDFDRHLARRARETAAPND
jgi:hypothetical protein